MSTLIASRRYAESLLTAAVEGNYLDQIVPEMKEINKTLHCSRELVHILASPLVKSDKKLHILDELFARHISKEAFQFLALVTKKKRAGILSDIINEFMVLLDEREGIMNVTITSATTLGEEQAERLVSGLANYTGKKIRATLQVDDRCIGGAAIKIGDTIFDGTVRHQLSRLRDTLLTEAR